MGRILTIIPARAGSKGIIKKNQLKISKYTLVERALFTALNCSYLKDIIVSTDSNEIQRIVNKYGAFSPFQRPKKFATDLAGSLSVIKHGLNWAEENYRKKYDFVLLLEPPCPFRLPKHISTAIEIAKKNQVSSVVSLVKVEDCHPVRMKKMDSKGKLSGLIGNEPDGVRRQDQEDIYIRNSAVYLFNRQIIDRNQLWGESPYGFEMDRKLYSINIDEPNDYLLAKAFYSKMKKENKLKLIESLPVNLLP